ncbi:hypothetical protein JXA02_13760 [candidate division KSB1 bacterium]|nr:hypothetical protein [candidate division KSB1 bacterium]
MLLKQFVLGLCVNLFCGSMLFTAAQAGEPVNPNASTEARALLKLLYDISGKYTLTGQHNYPNTRDRNSQFAARYTGEMPAIWSTDMGFAEDGDTDSYLARPDIVQEAIRQHKLGSLVTICWHAVPPTADEPVTFRPSHDADSTRLASVQGQLLDEQFKDVLTPGTELYEKWAAQVDSVAFYLQKLQQARVPILWRPYHEMNGDWFWWGGRIGEYSTVALYRQMFDRLVHHHKLDNLIWMWSVDRAHQPRMYYSQYYPGEDYLDVVSLDVYGSDFSEAYYDSLKALAHGKPLVLGEVGNPPTLEILQAQPLWGFWVVWAGMVRNTTKEEYQTLLASPRILTLDDPAHWEVMAPYRRACNLPPLPIQESPNLNGTWIFDEQASVLDRFGAGNAAYKLEIAQDEKVLITRRYFIVEWGDDRVTVDTLKLDGTESIAELFNAPRVTTATWSEKGDMLVIESKTTFTRGGRPIEMSATEKWRLQKRGLILSIEETATTFRGERTVTMVYKKQ